MSWHRPERADHSTREAVVTVTAPELLIIASFGLVIVFWVAVVTLGPTSHDVVACPVCDERNLGTQPYCATCQTDLGVSYPQDGELW